MLAIYFLALCALVGPSLQRWGPITDMNIIHSWNNLEYGFDSLADYDYAIQNGIYVEAGFKRPYDFANEIKTKKNRKPRIFLSTPRVVPGVPYTLAKISDQIGEYGPLLLPYPNFAAHSPTATPDCNRIISVFRIFTDPCNRLWAIDSGRNFFATPTLICPPKILVFDLETDTLIFEYVIPEDQYFPERSTHNGIIVDIYDPPPKGCCRKGKAYVTDARGPSYLVFDLATRTSWMITNDLFKADPAYISTTILGETFQFPDGLYTSTPYRKKNTVYLHAFASIQEIAAPLDVVNNKSLWENDPSANPNVFQPIGTRPTQSATQIKDSWGNIYSSLLDPLSIVSWNPNKPFSPSNLEPVVQNNQTINFVAGIKVVPQRRGKECLMALSIPLQKLNLNTISINETNYYLMECPIATLHKGRGSCIC